MSPQKPRPRSFCISRIVSIVGCLMLLASNSSGAQPGNDYFANAIWLTGTDIVTNGSNVNATREPGEPGLASFTRPEFDHSVWWAWTAPGDGVLRVTAIGTDFRPLAAVYLGSTITDLTEVGYSSYYINSMEPLLDVPVRSGLVYHIAVGDAYGPSGQINLHLSFWPKPANDDFAERIDLGTNHSHVVGTNGAASGEPGEPIWSFSATSKSVWWSWTAPKAGPVTITVVGDPVNDSFPGSSPWIGLQVFTGNSITSLVQVASQSDGSTLFLSQVTFDTTAGTVYQISVDGNLGLSGTFTLNVAQTRPPIVVLTAPVAGASSLSGAPILCSAEAFDGDGTVVSVDFRATDQNDYIYNPIGVLTHRPFEVTWTNPPVSWHGLIALAVDDLGAVGRSLPLTFNVRPFNDDFAKRIPITGSFLTVTGSTLAATLERNEPPLDNNSVWWSWTAPDSGPVTLTTSSGFALAVYTGSSVSNLTQLAYDVTIDNGYVTRTIFQAVAGASYQIAVNSWAIGGDFSLQIAQRLPPTVSITFPPPGSTFYSGDAITLQAEATNTDGTIARVDFYQDFEWIGSATNPPYSLTVPLTATAPIRYRLQAWATDTHNVTTRSLEVDYTVTLPGPLNDNFADRFLFTGLSATGSLAYATGEPGEPLSLDAHSVWWSWIAPKSGMFTCALSSEPGYYPAVGIFTGDALTNLVSVAYAAFAGMDNSYSVDVTFAADAGTNYMIGAAVTAGDPGGAYTLSVIPGLPPTVAILSPTNGQVFEEGTNITLTAEAQAPDGTITSVAYYQNSYLLGVATNPPFSVILSNVAASFFQVSAWATDNSGQVTRTPPISFTVAAPSPPPPPNDDFIQRVSFTGSFGSVTGSLDHATMGSGEPGTCVWWSWTAPATDLFTITAKSEPGYSPGLWVYTGESLTNLTLITNSVFTGSDNTYSTRVILSAQVGNSYSIAVGALGGSYELRVAESLPPLVSIASPTNGATFGGVDSITFTADASDPDGTVARVDFFLDYQSLGSVTNTPYSITYFIRDQFPGTHTLWASVTDNDGLTTLSSTVYFFAAPAPPANDAFAHAIPLSGFFATASASSPNGTTWEPGEPDASNNPGGGSAWWTWTAPASGTVLLTGQGLYSALSVFIGSNLLSLEPIAVGQSINTGTSFQTSFAVESGRTYQLAAERVGTFESSLNFTLLLQAQQFSGIERLSTGELRLEFQATPGPDWVLEASSDLSHWSPIDTNSRPSGLFEFIDPQPGEFSQRFYRARQQ